MLKFLELRGGPRERGEQHGEHFRDSVRELAEIRRSYFEKYFQGTPQSEIDELLKAQIQGLKVVPHLYEEFQAIARSSGVSESQLVILNNYTDLRDFSIGDDDGCSVFSYRKGASRMAGQTWDMHGSAARFMTYLHHPDSDLHILTVTGCLGLSGVNRDRVSVFINNLHCCESREQGLVWPVLVRRMLEERSASGAYQALARYLPASGHNYLICDPLEVLNVETTGLRFEIHHQSFDDGYYVHTNHYLSSLNETEILSRQSKTTHQRLEALQKYFSDRESRVLNYADLSREVLGGQVCKPVCIRVSSDTASATCGGIIFDYQSNRGEMFHGFYTDGLRREFYVGR